MSSDLSEAHTDTMQAVVDAMTDLDSTLPPVTCCDPAIARVATTLVKTGLEQQAAVASGKPIPYATFQVRHTRHDVTHIVKLVVAWTY